MDRKNRQGEVMSRARRNARQEDSYLFGNFLIEVVTDHILESQCNHSEASATCTRCLFFSNLSLPEFPEMIFPKNFLKLSLIKDPGCSVSFSALNALQMVISDHLPDIQVAPSAIWQQARKGLHNLSHAHPFDWTFTTEYPGTLSGCKAEPTDERIDMDLLKQQDAIGFYSQITLYEDELADHGCAQLTVRIRVMPTFFFILLRFYLRVDRVLIRVCDTRIVGHKNSDDLIREWSRRESKMTELMHLPTDVLLDGNRIWSSLPVISEKVDRISPQKLSE